MEYRSIVREQWCYLNGIIKESRWRKSVPAENGPAGLWLEILAHSMGPSTIARLICWLLFVAIFEMWFYYHAKNVYLEFFTLPSLHSSNPCDLRTSGPLFIPWYCIGAFYTTPRAHPIKVRMNFLFLAITHILTFIASLFVQFEFTEKQQNHKKWKWK